MSHYYLKIEGINLVNFVYDTNDLSTIRGGGLLLLDMPDFVRKEIKTTKLEEISLGASSGFFAFEAHDDQAASLVQDEVKALLSKNPNYCHATFVVDVVSDSGDYQKDRKNLLALGRWQQMSLPSLSLPLSCEPYDPKKPVCEFDYVRPATNECPVQKGSKKFAASSSVRARRGHGQSKRKKEWYEEKTGLSLPEFTSDFQELAEGVPDPYPKNLDGKMAVIYLDGNRFGTLHDLCQDRQEMKELDQTLRITCQDATLCTLLKGICNEPAWLTSDEKLRLETLLWGGDEIIWVVPAWKGWWMLGRFYEEVKKTWKYQGKQLTLAGGLVFCSHKAPIQRVISLSKALGDLAKGNRDKNQFAYQILESFDHAGLDLKSHWEKRLPCFISPEDMVLEGLDMDSLAADLKFLKKHLPKRQLYRFVFSLYQKENLSPEDEENFKNEAKQEWAAILAENIPEHCAARRESLKKKDPSYWLHMLELWDYVAIDAETKCEEAADVQN